MKITKQPSSISLREQAEEILKSRHSSTGLPLSASETTELIHELQLKQIELELQNKSLLEARDQGVFYDNSKKKILDLIDFEEVNKLLEGFNQTTGFVTAILDLEGNVLSKSGWRQICTAFHRINHETSSLCTISDTVLANKMAEGEKYHFYECLNGLVDVAVPIVINGEHIANLFSGQFFFDEPNLTFFKKQAEKYGFNEQKYLTELQNVPVVSKEKVKVAVDFLLDMTQLISEITYQKLEQVQLNEALIKSEERSRNALDHLLEGCQIIDFDWRYIYMNHTAEIHNKLPKEKLLGQRYMDMWPGIESTEVFKMIKRTLEERVSDHFENEFTFPDGSFGWFDLSIQPVPEGVFILSIDITERKITENLLRESEEKYRLIADNSDDWIYWVAPDGHLNYVSPACERVTGYSPEEFASHPDLTHEIVFLPDQYKISEHTNVSKVDNTPHNLEFRIVTKAGEIRWVNHSCSPIFDSEGKYLGRRGTNRNITERKLQEEQLFESEFRFSKLYENGSFGMVITDNQFRFQKANKAFCNIIGYSEAELQQITFKQISIPEDLNDNLSNISKLINQEIPVYKTEKRYIRKDREVIWGSLTVIANYDSNGEFLYNLGIVEDITNRKKVEEDLNKSRSLLAETESIGKVGGWEFNIDTLEQNWTDEVYRIHELDLNFKQDVDHGINFYSPASKPIIEKAVQRAIEFGEPFDLELEVITAKGNLKSVHSVGKADMENRRVYGFFQDITERKRAEAKLRERENKLSTILNLLPVGISILDENQKVVYENPALENILEITKEGLQRGAYHGRKYLRDDGTEKPASEFASARVFSEKKAQHNFITGIVKEDGKTVWTNVSAVPVEFPDWKVVLVTSDITQKKLSEEKIRELNERISTATRASQVGIWDWDVKNNMLVWDEQMYALYGLKKDEFTGAFEAWVNGLHPDDKEFCLNETQIALGGKKEYDTEFRVVWPDGTVHIEKAKGEVFRDESGEPIRMIGINYDITEQKKKDEKIREKDQEFRKLSANVPDLLFQFTRKPDGTYFVPIASEGIRNIFGCAPEDVVDDFTPIGRVIHPEDAERVIRDIEYSAEHLSFFTCEFRVQIPGREIQWIYSKSTPERLPDGSITWYGFNTDITHKKLAEETLKISEERYRNIFESAVIGIYRTTPEGKIIMANSTLIKLLGFDSFEDLAKRNLENEGYENKFERTRFRKKIEKKGSAIGLESVWKTKDGRPVIVNENAKAFYNSEGQVVYYEGTIEDITQRKQIEKTLRESEEKFRLAFATNPDAITITRLKDGVYVSVNNGFTQVFGYTEEEILGKASLEINMWCDPDDRKVFVKELQAKGRVENFEARLYTKDGKLKDTLVSSTTLDFDGLPHILSTTKDITERKRVEVALRESEEKFRMLIESIPLPVTYVNNDGGIIFRNDRFVELIGYTHEEVPTVNEWWLSAYPDEAYREWVIRNWESALEHAKKTNSDILPKEYSIVCKDRTQRIFIVSGILIDDNLLITFIDVTDRKKAEDEISKLNETLEQRVEERTRQLQEANQELEAFSYSVSHDLRAPLRHINGFVDLVTENYGGLLPDKGKHYLDVIVNSSRHMGTLIDDLLQFSRTGRQEMQEADLKMNVLLQDVLLQLSHDTEDRSIEWTIAELPNVKGDQALLRMVWYNLLGNAIKFTRAKDPAKIQIGFTEDQNEYTFFVRDNGAGFDMRFAHKLFGVFQRLHTTKEFEGTGIGLANVRRIILKHGGRTWAESQINEGAVFYFTLPKSKQ
jgi:PAS domain S-box-containing protein